MSKRTTYPKEFKLDAVSLVLEQGYSRAEAGKSLGINPNMISRWIKEADTDEGQSSINSGNLVTIRSLYERISGFDADLTTAKDYDFCRRAENIGAKIVNNEELVAIHLGYPKTILGFINRERWHGGQDCKNFASLKESKITWLAILNLFILCTSTFLLVLHKELTWMVGYILFLVALGSFLTLLRFKFNNLHLFPFTALLYSLYISGRSLSILDRTIKFLTSALKTQKS